MCSRRLAVFVCVIMGGIFTVATFPGDQSKKVSVEERRLIVVRGSPADGAITVRVGDVVQLQPFSLPVTPDYLEAKLHVDLEGDQVLEVIGQATTPVSGEGRTALSTFLLAREPGQTTAKVSVAIEGQKAPARHRASYVVECTQE